MNTQTAHSLFALVADELEQLEAELHSLVQSPEPVMAEIGLQLMHAGGKRLRPALYLLCARSGNIRPEELMPVAVAIELIHMATLVHDDVMDQAQIRRGRATANHLWGNSLTVLAGDCLFAKAFSVIAATGDSVVLKLLSDVVCCLCEGEILQTVRCRQPRQSEAEYLQRIAKKTADFIAVSCELGAISAQASSADRTALRRYGYCVGMAYQITDDILDITASPEQLGKQTGSDLRQGVVTLPVLYALTHSERRVELQAIVASRDITDELLAQGLALILATEAVAYSYQRAETFLAEAKTVLPAVLPSAVREALWNIADFIGVRNF